MDQLCSSCNPALWRCCLLLLCSLLLSACGFQLRGAPELPAGAVSSMIVQSPAGSTVAPELKNRLQLAGVSLTPDPGDETYTLRLSGEQLERSILSVAPASGKVEEYELSLSVNISLSTGSGDGLISGERFTASQDYSFDENAALSMFTQETLIREDLSRQIAARIIRRVEAATVTH